MKKISVFFVLVSLVFLTTACDNLDNPLSGADGLPGIVVSAQTNAPLDKATVSVAGQTALTNESGRFFFFDIRRGEQIVTVTRAGYVPYEARVTVTGSTELRIALVPQI